MQLGMIDPDLSLLRWYDFFDNYFSWLWLRYSGTFLALVFGVGSAVLFLGAAGWPVVGTCCTCSLCQALIALNLSSSLEINWQNQLTVMIFSLLK